MATAGSPAGDGGAESSRLPPCKTDRWSQFGRSVEIRSFVHSGDTDADLVSGRSGGQYAHRFQTVCSTGVTHRRHEEDDNTQPLSTELREQGRSD